MTKRIEYRVTLHAVSLVKIIICRPLGSKGLYPPLPSVEDTAPWIHRNDNTCAMYIKRAIEKNVMWQLHIQWDDIWKKNRKSEKTL